MKSKKVDLFSLKENINFTEHIPRNEHVLWADYKFIFMKRLLIMIFFILYQLTVCGQSINSIEGHTDTLTMNGVRYFFQITPLSIRKGYDTDVWNDREIHSLAYIIEGLGHFFPNKPKGYALNWVVKDNSLFIQDIKPRFEGYKVVDAPSGSSMVLPDEDDVNGDTLRIRLEKFTGSKFMNGHLFVDWITGDFVLFQINEDAPAKDPWTRNNRVFDNECFLPSLHLTVKKGKVVKIKESVTKPTKAAK